MRRSFTVMEISMRDRSKKDASTEEENSFGKTDQCTKGIINGTKSTDGARW